MKVKEIINLTKKLIEYKTISNDINENKKALDFIKNYLKNLDSKFYQKNNYYSLLVSNCEIEKNIKKFDLILHGHIDVITGKNEQFFPYIKENRIYGRGALDMKSGLSVLIFLMKNINETIKNKKILLMITSDEEIGGENGTNFLFKEVGVRGKFFITAEGEKKYFLKIKQKGVLMFKIVARTKGNHSAYTWNSQNAILKIFDFYNQAKKLFPEKRDKNHWYSTINLGTINGGKAINSIPNYCEANFDVRFCEPWKNPEEIFNKLKKIALKLNVEIKIIYKTNLSLNNKNNNYIMLLHKIAKKILYIKKSLFFNNHGTNDARFASSFGIPAIAFGPVGDNYHTNNEWVDIKSLEKYYLILKDFILNI